MLTHLFIYSLGFFLLPKGSCTVLKIHVRMIKAHKGHLHVREYIILHVNTTVRMNRHKLVETRKVRGRV